MIKHIIAGLLLGIVHGATVPMKAEPIKGYYTMDAMGCMILRECTKDVKRIKSIQDIKDHYPTVILVALILSLMTSSPLLIGSELVSF